MEPAFFIDVDKHARHVVGAYDFTPISTHYAHRFERFVYTDETSIADLKPIWLEVLEAAGKVGVASGWLLFQPDEHQIGLVTVIAQVPADDAPKSASSSIAALEDLDSLSDLFRSARCSIAPA